jgi:putative redox protein
MPEMITSADWRGGLGFDIHADGHTFIIDAPEKVGGKNAGPKPVQMLVAGLLSCTGMDVTMILGKMRVPLKKLHLDAVTEIAGEDPRVFRKIDVIYHFEGDADLREHADKIRKAIELSKQTYCGVSIMLSKACPITLRAFVNGEEIKL